MSGTTKLEAVNTMLSTIGESPVNSLTSGLVDAEMAETILNSVSKEVQSQGWNFNREYDYTIAPTAAGEVILPNNVLRADATLKADAKDLVQRGNKMYDKKKHTFNIGESTAVDMIVELDFEDLPEVAKRFIVIRSARIFQDRVVGSDTLHGFTQQDEASALYAMKDFELETEDFSIFNDYDVYRVIDRKGTKRLV
jgi:hypothetical protein